MPKNVRARHSSSLNSLEHCKNPWNGKCKNTDIELYITHKGVQHPICSRCWSTLAEKPIEWGEPSSTKLYSVKGALQ